MKHAALLVLSAQLVLISNCNTSSVVNQLNAQSSPPRCEALTSQQIEYYFIKSGASIGDYRLDDSRENIASILQKHPRASVVEYPDYSGFEMMISEPDSNINPYTIGSGIRAFVVKGKLSQIKVDSYLFSAEELTKNSSLQEVSAKYPNAIPFRLVGSASLNDPGSTDLQYLVDTSNGIAFEFYETRFKQSKVGNIYVFKPNTDFFPLGTVNSSQSMKLVKSK